MNFQFMYLIFVHTLNVLRNKFNFSFSDAAIFIYNPTMDAT